MSALTNLNDLLGVSGMEEPVEELFGVVEDPTTFELPAEKIVPPTFNSLVDRNFDFKLFQKNYLLTLLKTQNVDYTRNIPLDSLTDNDVDALVKQINAMTKFKQNVEMEKHYCNFFVRAIEMGVNIIPEYFPAINLDTILLNLNEINQAQQKQNYDLLIAQHTVRMNQDDLEELSISPVKNFVPVLMKTVLINAATVGLGFLTKLKKRKRDEDGDDEVKFLGKRIKMEEV